MTHTPTPWQLGHIMTTTKGRIWRDIYIAGGHIARVYLDSGNGQKAQEANAEHIVTCVNNHDRLVAALRDLVRYYDDNEWADEKDREARKASGGNVSAFDAMYERARSALSALDKR